MKKITSLGIALMMSTVVFAQHSSVDFGLKGGVNLANLKMSSSTLSSRTGLYFGGLAHIHLSPHFAIQPELNYSTQGAEIGNNNNYKMNYLNLPVLGQYMLTNGLRLQTGPQLGYMVKNSVGNNHSETSSNNTYHKTDFSWTFGGGYLTRTGLGFDARYNHGINDINRNNSGIRNRVWQLGVFYQF